MRWTNAGANHDRSGERLIPRRLVRQTNFDRVAACRIASSQGQRRLDVVRERVEHERAKLAARAGRFRTPANDS